MLLSLLAVASFVSGPVSGNAGQSGRNRNQRSSSHSTDAGSADSDTYSPAPTLRRDNNEEFTPGNYNLPFDPNARIVWEKNLSGAMKSAAEGSRVIVVDIYADWCGWCKKMDRTVYSDPKVASLKRDAVFLRLNAEDRGEGRQFAHQNRVTGLPTTVILDQNGTVLKKLTGYIGSPDTFINIVERVRTSR